MRIEAQFEKVSLKRFLAETKNVFAQVDETNYDNLPIPRRATAGSAGYDFFAPAGMTIFPGKTVKIPTGIRVRMPEDYFLAIVPRSSLGFKYRMRLDNTVGIIDRDYYHADNEGHIFIKVTNEGSLPIMLDQGEAFAQGIFLPFVITEGDRVSSRRTGGIGSTSV